MFARVPREVLRPLQSAQSVRGLDSLEAQGKQGWDAESIRVDITLCDAKLRPWKCV